MDASAWLWTILVASALGAGACFVLVLIVRPRTEAIVAILGLVSFGVTAVSLATTVSRYGRLDAAFYALAFIIAGLVGGWTLASSLLDRLARTPSPLRVPDQIEPARDDFAAIVVSCFEPPEYDPRATAGMLQSLVDEDLLELSLGTTPFLFFAQKARYRSTGGTSPAASELASMAERLESMLAESRVGRVDWASCSGETRLAARVADAAAAGYKKIAVVGLTVSETLHLAAAKSEADSLHLDERGVEVVYAEALSDSDRLAATLCRRVLTAADTTATTGAVLVGHGQPESRAKRNPVMDIQETAFLNRVRMMLLERGLPEANVRVAWAEWHDPDITSTVRHLAALGCRRVVVVPAVYPLDSLATRLDLEIAVRQARVDTAVTIVTLPAWRDDDTVMAELADRVRTALGV